MAKNKKRRHLASKRQKFESKDKQKFESRTDPQMSSDVNPFEFHRNKVKHNIIGRKIAKNEISNKGLSRNRAYNKRKNTILEEYKTKHKTGKGLQDLRNKDNKEIKRMNESIDMSFDDNTVLTHKGKHLNDFIDDTIGSDDEDIDLFNRPDFVESTHFGGGSDGRPKSANEVLNQIMDEKRDKQLERQANIDLTEKLDTEWLSVKNILRHKGVKQDLKDNTREDFDILVKELMFKTDNKPIVSVKPLPTLTKQTAEEFVDKEIVESVEKNVDLMFKDMIVTIERQDNWTQIWETIKDSTNNLLPKISSETLSLLLEKYQTIIETKSGFTAKNLAFLLLGTHFKQTKLMVQLILIQMLNKIQFNSFKDIAIVLVIIKVLIITSNGKYIPEVFNSILNIICLSQSKQTIELSIGDKLKTKLKCLLSLSGQTVEKPLVFAVKYIFNETFNNFETLSENEIKSMLFLQTLKTTEELCDLYSNIPSFNELIIPLKRVCSDFVDISLPEDIQQMLDKVLTKLSREEPKGALIERRPKPFMLPMFEPKFEDNNINDRKSSKKKLVKKYNRELKGAKRELRKDNTFMRNTWTQEMKANDEKRNRKVKELFGDLAQQQGIYKKTKK